jgi:hypothetical protein
MEKKMADMQEEVCFLQDAFSASAIIEDNEARALMTATALKSCEDVIFNLQEQQKKSLELEKVENARIKALRERLQAIKSNYGRTVTKIEEQNDLYLGESKVYEIKKERLELESICEKIRSLFEMDSDMSVGDVAEKIDQLVNKVVDLELLVSSQTAQLNRLNLENSELEKSLENLETEKGTLVNDSEQLEQKLGQADEELSRAQRILKVFRKDENMVRLNFSEAVNSLGNISEKLESPLADVECTFGNSEPDNCGHGSMNDNGFANSLDGSVQFENGVPGRSTGFNNLLEDEDGDDSREIGLSQAHSNQNDKGGSIKTERSTRKKISSKNQSKLETNHCQNGTSSPTSSGMFLQCGDRGILDGGEEKKDLPNEYNTVLEDYNEMKKRLAEIETKNQENVHELLTQITALMNENAVKDEEILSLKRLLETSTSCNGNTTKQESSVVNTTERVLFVDGPEGRHQRNLSIWKDLNLEHMKKANATNGTQCTVSPLEEKFRTDIDALLEDNLEFWMRFSTSIQRIQEFQTKYQQLLKDEKALKSNSTGGMTKDFRALKTELQVWLEQNALLRSDLQSRLTSIGNVQDEINQAVGPSFTSFQAAKFQGEVLNMQQENNRVADELRAALDQVRGLQTETEKTLERQQDSINISESSNKTNNRQNTATVATKNNVPLRSFLFPTKTKKPSIFAYVNPVLQRKM